MPKPKPKPTTTVRKLLHSLLTGLFTGATLAAAVLAAACSSYAPSRMYSPMTASAQDLAGPEAGEAQPQTEAYDRIVDNPFLAAKTDPLSTFSVDVDTASYANVRRFLDQGQLPPKDAVRIEELVNYFPYAYPAPQGDGPFAVHAEVSEAPWAPGHRLVKLGIKGREIDTTHRPPANLIFLLDVSGSMDDPRKLPLLKEAFGLLLPQLGEADRVAIVVYAGASGLVLPSTPASERGKILAALDQLQAGGSTNGAGGIELAYQVAAEAFRPGGINRVILATDGDFNVGPSSNGELTRLVEEKAKSGIALTVLGFGMGNLKDSTLEALADHGDGNYAYVDTLAEARKVLVEQMTGTLITIARDVKLQVEFNPAQVAGYRLIGYENRLLRAQDFNDDRKDAGEIGAGHTVTALYELVPVGQELPAPGVDPLRYQTPAQASGAAATGELLTVKVRFKPPEGGESRLLSFPVADGGGKLAAASGDLRFAAAVATFGMVLRASPYKGSCSLALAQELAASGRGADVGGHRAGFEALLQRAAKLSR